VTTGCNLTFNAFILRLFRRHIEILSVDSYLSMFYNIMSSFPQMTRDKKTGQTAATAATVAALLCALAFLPTLQNAAAQGATAYGTSYTDAGASSDFNVKSEYHIYKPGDTVRIEGSMSSQVKDETKAEAVRISIIDAKGGTAASQQASVDSSGHYSALIMLPADAEQGKYTADSKIQVSASALGLLSADVTAKLESSTQFMVGSTNSFDVQAQDGQKFKVEITSNSNVSNVRLDEEAKNVSFTVEGETGTAGVADVTVPKAMLSGDMTVMIDGQAIAAASNSVIVRSQTSTDTTLEVNYHHSRHTVQVAGTNVVPEFPLSALVMTAAVASVVGLVAAARTGRFGGLWH
jgi:hypothetical protein